MTNLEKAAMRPVYILSKWINYKEKSSPYNLYQKNASNDSNSNNYGAKDYTMFNQYFNDLYKNQNIDFYMTKGKNQGVEWCDITVHWAQCMAWGPNTALQVLRTTKYKGGYYQSRACKNFYTYAKAWIKGNESNGTPKIGDQIFFFTSASTVDPNHTGIVSNVTSEYVEVIEGNASANGEGARYLTKKTYKRKASNIDGYGRPNYDLVKDQFENINYDDSINLAAALFLTDSEAIAQVNSVMGTVNDLTSSSNDETIVSNEEELQKKSYELSEKEIEEIKTAINNAIDTYKQAILNYNNGTITQAALESAQRTYEAVKNKYNNYVEKSKDKISNFDSVWKYIKLLTTTEFPKVSELERKRSLGDIEWFKRFEEQYDILIKNFFDKVNNLYSALIAQIQNGFSYDENNYKYSYSPTITKPNNADKLSINFLWSVLFEDVLGPNKEKYLKDYTNDTEGTDYDRACYDAYEALIEYYDNIITKSKEEINQYSIEQNISAVIQELLNILQADIYKLYAMTYGKIIQNKSDNTTTYEKSGVAYNFGGNNEDYWNFYNKYKISIFSNYMYLNDIAFNDVQIHINNIIRNLLILEQNRKDAVEALSKNQINYENKQTEQQNEIVELCEQGGGLVVDWRELIYQMAKDYYNYANNPKYDYNYILRQNNKDILQLDDTTGYEVFYTDLLGFWRQLYYNPLLENIEFDIEENTNYLYTYLDYVPETCWNKIIYSAPSKLNFWFDLTEGSGEINNYQISLIGDRLKATKDTKITALYQAEVPNIIYYEQENISYIQENAGNASYSYFQIGGPMSDVYTISSQGRSAIDLLQEQLYKFIYCTENVTITTLPIYTLQPNYRVIVNSRIPGLSGEYIVTKYSIPFTYNATMSITTSKAVPYIGING